MKLSDTKRRERADKLKSLEALAKAAKGRAFTADEQKAWDETKSAMALLDAEIASAVDREETLRSGAPAAPLVVTDERGNPHTILRSGDRMAERHMAGHRELLAEASLGHAIRGIVTGNWDGRAVMQRALGEATLAGGGYAIPAPLAARFLDLMRSQSVMMQAGTGTLPMDALTLRVAGLATDPVPTSRKENTDVAKSDPTFRAVDLKARSYGVIVTSSLELLADSPNAAAMIEASIIGAMAVAFDAACLKGDGSTTGDLDNVLGLLNLPGLPAVPPLVAPVTNYDAFIDAIALIEGANMVPNAVIQGVGTADTLAKLKTGIAGDQTTLVPPAGYTALKNLKTTAMPAATAVVADFARGVVGLREAVTLEITRVSDTAMSKAQIQVRALMRFDYAALYLGGFAKVSGVAPASAAARRAA